MQFVQDLKNMFQKFHTYNTDSGSSATVHHFRLEISEEIFYVVSI